MMPQDCGVRERTTGYLSRPGGAPEWVILGTHKEDPTLPLPRTLPKVQAGSRPWYSHMDRLAGGYLRVLGRYPKLGPTRGIPVWPYGGPFPKPSPAAEALGGWARS